MQERVLEAIKRSAAVPSPPQLVRRFLEVIQDPEFDYNDLATVLSADPGTVSEILRFTNSALFGLARKVTSLRHALTMLGPRRTRSLVLGRFLVESLNSHAGPSVDRGYYWRRSLATAVLAARFAIRIIPSHREDVFIAGLLADIGIPVLAQAFPRTYQPLVARYCPHGEAFTEADELAAVEITHSQVSAMVLEEWKLPRDVCAAVRSHHANPAGIEPAAVFARLVGGADCIAKFLCEIPDIETVAPTCAEVAQSTGVGLSALCDILGAVEGDLAELAGILGIDVVPNTVYAMIAHAIQESLAAPAGA